MIERPGKAPARRRWLPAVSTLVALAVPLGLATWLVAGADGREGQSLRPATEITEEAFAIARHDMIEGQLRSRGIDDPQVLTAMDRVPRHRFVPEEYRGQAYDDHPLPIGWGQTISQPYVVALMADLLELEAGDRVLEIGTGSGYNAAVLSQLAGRVYSIEIVDPLGRRASHTLADLGYDNVEVRVGNGYLGWPEQAPFDAIVLTAAPPKIPEELLLQVTVGGRVVLPVGVEEQELVVLTRTADGWQRREVLPVRFVPMTGRVREES